eukprot:14252584-Alexandrium_andersonii.AAC.1
MWLSSLKKRSCQQLGSREGSLPLVSPPAPKEEGEPGTPRPSTPPTLGFSNTMSPGLRERFDSRQGQQRCRANDGGRRFAEARAL